MPRIKDLLRDLYGQEEKVDNKVTRIEQDDGSNVQGSWYGALVNIGMSRQQRYRDFDDMDSRSTEVTNALDIYADDATPLDANRQKTIWVTSENKEIVDLADALFEEIEVEEIIWSIARDTAKYGESIKFVPQLRLSEAERQRTSPATERKGIQALEDVDHLRVNAEIERGIIKKYIVDEQKNDPWDPWDFFHPRLRGRSSNRGVDQFAGAHSMLESARPIWRMLNALETGLAMSRLSRGPSRNVFYIDTTGLSVTETVEAINQYRAKLRRNTYIRQDSGEFTSTVNPMVESEDIYWPVKQGMQHRVETIGGGIDVRAIEDIKYYRDKMLMALKIPREFLAFEGGGGLVNTSLSIKDMRFARSIRKLQRAVVAAFVRLVQVEMALRGFDPEKNEFQVHMGVISMVEELQKIEVLKEAVEMAEALSAVGAALGRQGDPVWMSTMLRTVYGFISRSMGIPELMDAAEQQTSQMMQGPAPSQVPVPTETTRSSASARVLVTELGKLAGPEDKKFIENLEKHFVKKFSKETVQFSSREFDDVPTSIREGKQKELQKDYPDPTKGEETSEDE